MKIAKGKLAFAILIFCFIGFFALFVIHQSKNARAPEFTNVCINHLRIIDAAKAEWALNHKKTSSDTPSWEDLKQYLPRQEILKCPLNGLYTIGCVSNLPTCSIAGHVLQ